MAWLDKLWKGITGSQGLIGSAIGAISGSVNAKREREWNAEQAEINRTFQSNEAALQRDWSAAEAERARDWQEEMYDKYNSLSGKIQQAHEAGVNPMLAITGNAVSPMSTSSPMPSGASAGSVGNPAGSFVNIIGEMLGLQKLQAETRLINSEADNLDKNTSWIDSLNTISISKLQSDMEKNSSEVALNLQNVKESISRVTVNDSVVELNGAKVKLVGNEADLTATKNAFEKLNVQQMQKLMPYVEARQEASIALAKAQTYEAKNNADKLMYDANVSMLKGMVEANLLDSEYYDNVIMQSKYDAKSSKRSYHWKPINDVCSNISKIAVGIGSAVSAATGAGAFTAAAASVSPPAILSFF